MKKMICLLLSLPALCGLKAQLVLQPGAQFTGTTNLVIAVENMDVINEDAATDLTRSYLYMRGQDTNQLQGAGNWRVWHLSCYKFSGVLQLAVPVQVTNELQTFAGLLDLNGQTLTLEPGALLVNEHEASRVVGPNGGVIQTTVNLQAPQALNPGGLGAIMTSGQNLGNVTVKRWHGPATTGKINRYFEIIPTNITALNATLKFQYLDAELNNQPEAALALFTRTNGTSPWTALGWDTRDLNANYVSKSGINAFTQYTLGPAAAGPLPVKWGEVSVSCQKPDAVIQWTTFVEENVKSFTVQKSVNASQWTNLATLSAKGTGAGAQNYQYRDKVPGAVAYYRVVSTDLDGKTGYSTVKQLNACESPAMLTLLSASSSEAQLMIRVPNAGQVGLQLVSSDGKVVYDKRLNLVAGPQQVSVPLQTLAAGVYYIVLSTREGVEKRSFFKG